MCLVSEQTNRRCFRSRAAYTLAEVLIAIIIVGFMFSTVYSGITQSFNITRATEENLRAIQMLQDKTEIIHLYTWDQLNDPTFMPTTFTNWFFPAGVSSSSSPSGGVPFKGTISIANLPLTEGYAADLKLVTVTVSWTSGGSDFRQHMTTLISHYGMQNYIYN